MKNMFLETPSPMDYPTTLSKTQQVIETAGWKVLATHNLQQSLKNKGYDVLPVSVIELCNPSHSVRLLEKSDERIYSSLMPCRISVYEKEDGKTYVSRLDSGNMAAMIGGLVEEVMKDATREMEVMIASALQE
ncbi:MAG: DUF302 domain-containing protein [Bacteroidota bacterium]